MILPLPWEAVRCISLKPRAGRDGKWKRYVQICSRVPRLLAELALEANETLATLRPLYLRPPDAKPQASMAVARR